MGGTEMKKFMNNLKRVPKDESGASWIEYGLVVALLSILFIWLAPHVSGIIR